MLGNSDAHDAADATTVEPETQAMSMSASCKRRDADSTTQDGRVGCSAECNQRGSTFVRLALLPCDLRVPILGKSCFWRELVRGTVADSSHGSDGNPS